MTTTPSSTLGGATTPSDAAALLRRHRLRCTPSRLHTLVVLSACGRHLCAAEVSAELHRHGAPVAPSTVYRTLDALTEAGIAHAVRGPGATRYAITSKPHHHAVCRQCGQVEALPVEHLRGAVERLTELTGWQPDASGAFSIYYCRCAHCAE